MKSKLLWLSVIVFAVLAVVFALTDWQISQAVYNPEAGWAKFLEAYGQMPGAFVGLLCGSILLRTYKVEKNIKSLAGVIGLFLLTAFAAFGLFADAFGAQIKTADVNLPLILVSAIAALIILQFILHRFSFDAVSQYKNAAKVGLAVMFIAGIMTVWVIKIPWGRWTYRDILEAGNPALFSPWYLPQGNNGHHSFPSGHTAFAFCALPLILFLKKSHRAYNLLLIALLLWGVLVGVSRVVIGAHFASDVLFGAGETLLWFWIIRGKFSAEA
jgi:membrane-associated phospholipid phosphatase